MVTTFTSALSKNVEAEAAFVKNIRPGLSVRSYGLIEIGIRRHIC